MATNNMHNLTTLIKRYVVLLSARPGLSNLGLPTIAGNHAGCDALGRQLA